MKACGYTEFGSNRAYYDFLYSNRLDNYYLIVASGYRASIEIYNQKLLLCADISHKLINTQSVLDLIESKFAEHSNDIERAKVEAQNEIVGNTVITR